MSRKPINRSLADPMMDDIDHALGRPVDPGEPTYRNHYAASTGSEQSDRMHVSPWWEVTASYDQLTFFRVTRAGREALAAYLKDTTP